MSTHLYIGIFWGAPGNSYKKGMKGLGKIKELFVGSKKRLVVEEEEKIYV